MINRFQFEHPNQLFLLNRRKKNYDFDYVNSILSTKRFSLVILFFFYTRNHTTNNNLK